MTTIIIKHLASQLKNIGPVMANKLIRAGIDSPEKLRKLGAKSAYLKIYRSGGFCDKFHVGYLYALEGAIQNCDWLKLSKKTKQGFKSFINELKSDSPKKNSFFFKEI